MTEPIQPRKGMNVVEERNWLRVEKERLQARLEAAEEAAHHVEREADALEEALRDSLYAWGLVAESENPSESDREEAAERIRKARKALRGEAK